jgi:hypothetical protein
LQVVCWWAFWVCGTMLWWRLLMIFIGWWWWVLGWWHLDVWWRWVGVGLVVLVFERRLLPLFLVVKGLNGLLEICKSCSFSVDVLPSSFNTLNYCLPPPDGFMFLMKPLNLLLDSEQLFLFCSFFFKGFFLPLLYLDLLDLDVSVNDLYWLWYPWGCMVWDTSVGLG